MVDIHCEYCNHLEDITYLDSSGKIRANVSLNFLHTLKEKLQQSPIFKNSRLSLIARDSMAGIIKNPLMRSKEEGLILVLDSIYLKDTVLLQRERYTDYLTANFAIAYKFGCKTYLRKNMELNTNYLLEDTAFWPAQNVSLTLYLEVPEMKDAIWDTGIKAGEEYARYLAPYWVEQSRLFYYGNNKSFKSAFELIQKSQLDSAIQVLKSEAEVKPGKIRAAHAFHNLAVVYELKDDFTNALAMSDSSGKIKNIPTSKDYSETLRLRKIDKIALDWQLQE